MFGGSLCCSIRSLRFYAQFRLRIFYLGGVFNEKHKKFLSLLLAGICLICLVTGCSNPNKPPLSSSNSTPSATPHIPILKEIEITLDNWSTYFEFVEMEEEYKNKYNETEHIQHYYSFVLKEDYVLAEKGTNISVEYSFTETQYRVREDLVNKKIIWGEQLEEGAKSITEEITIKWDKTGVAGETFTVHGTFKSKCSDFKVLRIYGTLAIME